MRIKPLFLLALGLASILLAGVSYQTYFQSTDPVPLKGESGSGIQSPEEAEEELASSAERGKESGSGQDKAASARNTEEGAPSKPDLTSGQDIDNSLAQLINAFEEGQADAGWKISQLASYCLDAPKKQHVLPNQIDSEVDPERRQELQQTLEFYEQIAEPCENSQLWEADEALRKRSEWAWRSAVSGNVDAIYSVVFEPYTYTQLPTDIGTDDTDDRLALRQSLLSELKKQCHAEGLSSLGVHVSRETSIVAELDLEDIPGVDGKTARQMHGFAFRYVAAQIDQKERPAHSARDSQHPLTAGEEAQAVALAEDILGSCP